MNLSNVGWTSQHDKQFEPWKEKGFYPARVTSEFKNLYRIVWQMGELDAQVTGKMMYEGASRIDYPAVGDFVAVSVASPLDPCIIHSILPRKSQFARKMAGGRDLQIIATNIDYAFIVSAFDHDFNLRRIERYLTLAWESGASPVIVLNKADQCENLTDYLNQIQTISMGCPVHGVSCHTGYGFEELETYTKPGTTIALLGSSGVGKSSLINYLLGGIRQKTNSVRSGDDHGRHTTTSRQMFILENGGIVIDTPGMRELGMAGSTLSLESSFEDINTLAKNCRFDDCEHLTEPGCAVMEAVEKGLLDMGRLTSYHKLMRELRNDKKQRMKMISKWSKQLKKMR